MISTTSSHNISTHVQAVVYSPQKLTGTPASWWLVGTCQQPGLQGTPIAHMSYLVGTLAAAAGFSLSLSVYVCMCKRMRERERGSYGPGATL